MDSHACLFRRLGVTDSSGLTETNFISEILLILVGLKISVFCGMP